MKASFLWVILAIATAVLAVPIILIILAPTCPSGTTTSSATPTLYCLPAAGTGATSTSSGTGTGTASTPTSTPLDVAGILGLIGLAAVGIERLIEGIWSVVDMSAGSFWPLNVVAKQIKGEVDALGQPLEPFIEQFSKLVDQGNIAVGTLKPDEVKKDLNNSIDELKKIAARNVSSQLFVTGAEQKLRELQKKYQLDQHNIDINTLVQAMKDGTKDFDTFVQSFKDNPGRRLVSLYIGIVLGLVVALFFKLDLLATVLKTDPIHSVVLGVIIAGIVMGLGSSPAHEIVQAILNYRKSLTNHKPGTTNPNGG